MCTETKTNTNTKIYTYTHIDDISKDVALMMMQKILFVLTFLYNVVCICIFVFTSQLVSQEPLFDFNCATKSDLNTQ